MGFLSTFQRPKLSNLPAGHAIEMVGAGKIAMPQGFLTKNEGHHPSPYHQQLHQYQ